MTRVHLYLLFLATFVAPTQSFSRVEHDLSASCYLYETIFALDDGPSNINVRENTLLMYKSIDDLDQQYNKIKLPVSIHDPEGLACEADDLFVVTGEYDEAIKDKFLTYHFKIRQEGKTFRAELVNTIPTLSIFQHELINIFSENEFQKILTRKSREGGLNIEGLAITNGVLSFGLRSPLKDGNAIIITTETHQGKFKIDSFLIDLKNKGIRGLDSYFDTENRLQHFAVAGPTDRDGGYSLWHFSRYSSDKINPLNGLCRPEGVVKIPNKDLLFIQSELSGNACEDAKSDHLSLFLNQQSSF